MVNFFLAPSPTPSPPVYYYLVPYGDSDSQLPCPCLACNLMPFPSSQAGMGLHVLVDVDWTGVPRCSLDWGGDSPLLPPCPLPPCPFHLGGFVVEFGGWVNVVDCCVLVCWLPAPAPTPFTHPCPHPLTPTVDICGLCDLVCDLALLPLAPPCPLVVFVWFLLLCVMTLCCVTLG